MIETAVGMFKKLTGNLGLKLVSLGLAFLLWLFVVSIENPVMSYSFSSIPITVENADVMEDQGKAFELNDSSRSVTVTVKAERSVLSELSRDNIKATVDMAELNGNKVPINVKSTRYADRIQNISPAKEYANVTIEDLASSQFRIHVETNGNLPEGYAVGTCSVQNNVVRVKGPESIVNSISDAVVRVNVSGMTNEIHTVLPILLLDESGAPVDTETLEVSLDQVSTSVEIWKVVEIPVYGSCTGTPALGFVPTGTVTVDPSTIFVTGDSKALGGLSSVTIPEGELDITGATGDVTAEIKITGYLPEGIYPDPSRGVDTVKITANVEQARSEVLQVPYSNLQVTGLPENMTVGNDMTASMVAVTVRGLKSTLDGLKGESMTGVLDLSEVPVNENGTVTPGSYAGAVTLNLPEGVTQDTAVAHVLLQVNGDTADSTDDAVEDGQTDDGNDTPEDGEDGE